MPADLIGSLTGLTEGRFPVYARARYADDLAEQQLLKRVQRGQNAANVVESTDDRRSIDIFAAPGAPVVAVNDGVIEKIDRNRRLGRFVVLQDVYGNRYTYAHLGSVSREYPVPKRDAEHPDRSARAAKANGDAHDPKPAAPASAGRQLDASDRDSQQASAPVRERLFAHPSMEGAREFGGLEQLLDAKARRDGTHEVYKNYFSRPFGLDTSKVTLRRLKVGSRVIGGTIIGRIDRTVPGTAAHVDFSIRPAGRGAPKIDPKPILDGWKLLEATAIYRASGRNVLHGEASIGQVLLLPKTALEKRVLADERIDIYECGRDDIRSGQIDRRVLATLAYLAESGLRPTVTSLRCGHGFYTSSGNVSEHSSGNAVDIAAVNGIPILGHQEPGGITEQTVRRLMPLQGTMAPHQIISLLDIGGPTFAMADHADHIHVGFKPMFDAESQGRRGGAHRAQARPVDRLDRSAARDRQPGRAHHAVQARAADEKARERRPRRRLVQNRPIGTMTAVAASLTLRGMFERMSKSSSAAASALELSPGADVGDPTGMRGEHLREWRDAANQVVSAYKAWCAPNGRDRQELYSSYLDALGGEERAAHQVERDASAPG